jgi:hypothetical protein
MTVDSASSAGAAAPIQVEIGRTDGTDWHVQVHETGLNLAEGAAYTAIFEPEQMLHEKFP